MTIAEENEQVLFLVQALIGAISSNVRRVTIEVLGNNIKLHFLLEEDSEAYREEIEEVAHELQALQETPRTIDVTVRADRRPIWQVEPPGRVVYGRREH